MNTRRLLLALIAGLVVVFRASAAPAPAEWFSAARRGEVKTLAALLARGAELDSLDDEGYTALFRAVDNGREEAALYLAGKGAQVDRTGPALPTPLLIAALRGDVSVVRALLDRGANANIEVNLAPIVRTDTWRSTRYTEAVRVLEKKIPGLTFITTRETVTPLCLAPTGGRVEVAAALVEHGANVNFANKTSGTPLTYAAKRGASQFVELLLRKGADPRNHVDDVRNAAEAGGDSDTVVLIANALKSRAPNEALSRRLLKAVSLNQYEMVGALIYKGADVNYTNERGETPILGASADIARLLVDNGAKPDITPPKGYGKPPFWRAVDTGSLELLEVLASKGIRQERLDSLLIYAAQRGQTKIAQWLLARGANPNARDDAGHNALVYALLESQDEVAEVLRKAGSATITPDKTKVENPLFHALEKHELARLKLLLERGIDPNWTDSSGYTPLGKAVGPIHNDRQIGAKWLPAATLLLEHGAKADPSVAGFQHIPVIYHAIEAGDLAVLKLMVQNGADPDEEFPPGPLFKAIQFGEPDIVQYLLERKVSLDRKDNRGRTPMAAAVAGGNEEIIAMLRKAGARE
jgi:ankyrin repeat protein